ncbi:hypothetical protein H0H93_005527, partial [Arthromyces matolae]
PKLIPADIKKKALFEQAASIELNNFDPFASKAVAEIVFKPYLGLTPNKEVHQELIVELGKRLDAYNVILSKQKYIAGD